MYVSPIKYGLTPLMMATMNGKVAAASVLLEAGADVNLQSNNVRIDIALMVLLGYS
jgi:ankyrin repeat protein